jgi:hypothetical protein
MIHGLDTGFLVAAEVRNRSGITSRFLPSEPQSGKNGIPTVK